MRPAQSLNHLKKIQLHNIGTIVPINFRNPTFHALFVIWPIIYLSRMLSYRDEYFMRLAIKEAEKAFEADEVPVGAVVVIKNKIVARGYNQVELLNDPTAHAEILAITSACNYLGAKYLMDAILYVTVEPCLMCCGALYWCKIGRIVYGADDDKNGYRKYIDSSTNSTLPFHPKTELHGGILKEECAELMKEFFRRKR